jgi:hypothetical protein
MPVCSFVFSRGSISREEKKPTIFRTYPMGKASVELEACMGVEPKLVILEILRRDLDKKAMKEIEKLRSGDKIVFSVTKELAPDKIRVKLIKEEE